MRLDVGPVAPVSVVAWIEWVRTALGELDAAPQLEDDRSSEVLAHVGRYAEQCVPRSAANAKTLRWSTDVDPDELEYLLHAIHTLDVRLSPHVRRGQGTELTDEGRVFYLVLVRSLLHALESESSSRAAFVDQLRSSWPSAAEAS